MIKLLVILSVIVPTAQAQTFRSTRVLTPQFSWVREVVKNDQDSTQIRWVLAEHGTQIGSITAQVHESNLGVMRVDGHEITRRYRNTGTHQALFRAALREFDSRGEIHTIESAITKDDLIAFMNLDDSRRRTHNFDQCVQVVSRTPLFAIYNSLGYRRITRCSMSPQSGVQLEVSR